MANKSVKKGLGKGLDIGKGLSALLGEDAVRAVEHLDEGSPRPERAIELPKDRISTLRLSEIEPNILQPRKQFDEDALLTLSESIRRNGLIQPIAVRRMEDGVYRIIAGERRWRAARMAELSEVPVVILEADELRAAELALIENLQREDLNPIEEAEGYRSLIEGYGLTQEEAAERVGKSRPAITNALRLLALEPEAREMLSDGTLLPGHARALLTLGKRDQLSLAHRIRDEGLSARQVERIAAKLKQEQAETPEKKQKKGLSVNYLEILQEELTEQLGRRVTIVRGKQKGRVELEYYGNEDLSKLAEQLASIRK